MVVSINNMAAAVERREQYVGEKHKSVREGAGSYDYDNKFFKYEGQWKNGKKHGTGKLVFVDGSYYEGTFQHGEIEGFGTRYFAKTGIKYQGQFLKGEFQGKGRMVWPDGSIYEGQWDGNKRQGFGVMKSVQENCMYKGSYYNNKRQGQGTMIYPKGDRYDGDWERDLRHGDGDMKFIDGTVYEGQFEDDFFNGVGTMRHCSGLTYHGTWNNGNPSVLPSKLVFVNNTGKDTLEFIVGQPFELAIKCVTDNGDIVDVDSGRELKITAGFKHIKAKKGTALFDLIEEYEEKPMATPFYEVLQYPLTDFLAEEEEEGADDKDDDLKEEADDVATEIASQMKFRRRSLTATSLYSTYTAEEDENTIAETLEEEEVNEDTIKEPSQADDPTPAPTESALERHGSVVSIPDTPMSLASGTASALEGSFLEKDSRPLPPPVANKRSYKGICEWKNIELAQAPPRFPPFVALDEDQKKLHARQNKQVEAKRLNRVAHDERYARVGEYVIMVHDVTTPPFMGQTLEPAYILVKLKKPKREKKPKEVKPKWDTSKHISQGMVRT